MAKAAASLLVDASTISRRLAILEATLGATLFERGRHGVTPTEAAEDLLPIAEEMEASMMRFAHAADGLEREVSGLVRITCSSDVAEVVVIPALRDLIGRYPALRFEVIPGESVLDLTRREADIALRTVHPGRGDLVVTTLATARWVLVAAPDVVREIGNLHAWKSARWVGVGERLAHLPPARWLAKHAPEVEPVMRSDSLRAQMAAVMAGLGVALLPGPSVKHHGLERVALASGLKAAASEWPNNQLYLVTHRALRNVPRVRVVWDKLLEARSRLRNGRLRGEAPS